MIYIEHRPAPALNRFVRMLWYTQAPEPGHRRERVLPTGRTQVILNLARDYILDTASSPDGPLVKAPHSLIVGARSVFEVVDTSDMADLIGVVFEPGALPLFTGDAADLFSNRSIALEDLWGTQASGLRDRLRELSAPGARLAVLEEWLTGLLHECNANGRQVPSPVVYALAHFHRVSSFNSVREVARSTGWSERRFSQVFRESVGLTPKVWCRIQRFQRAVARLHSGRDVHWTELALDCGFYDQSHFANEFRAFSGIDPTTYSSLRATPWANHVPVE
ncbi:AraC family transcriptional regulator [Acidobacteria bacterium AB60]|nr:AraC family transcriptional regulator [Acidobacteria bacterium AB60]